MPKFSLLPRDPRFFELFEKSTDNVAEAAAELHALFHDYTNVPQKVERITEFVDREDIAFLAQGLDDVMDLMEDAANAMLMYRIPAPTKRAGQLTETLVGVTSELVKAMPNLRKRSRMSRILEHCVEINRLENEADSTVRFALAELFDDMPIADVIKWREIYEHLEDAVDKAEDVANVLEGVVLKHG
jgi:uncharacterized protein Yka (UPF0111/DUF47 family)